MKNVVAFISIEYEKSDMTKDPNIVTYDAFTPNQALMISWAKVVGDSNLAERNINQGESADLNIFRCHKLDSEFVLQVASENGFSHGGKKSRLLLRATKDYRFKISITAENLFPIHRKFVFSALKHEIILTR